MANSAGMVKESIWRDKDFRALPRTAQALYVQLLSQKELDRAGIQPLQVAKWAKGCDETAETDIRDDLKMLQERRFVFFDEDTDELFVRSYMRQSEVVRYPNILKNALKCAAMVASPLLRHELAAELRRLRRAEASRIADDLDPPGAVIPPEPFAKPSETLPKPLNRSGTVREPQGVGEGERVNLVGLGNSWGDARANSTTTDDAEPPAKCPKHQDDPAPPPCGNCADARKAHDTWQTRHEQVLRDNAATRRRAIDRCDACDQQGWRNGVEPVVRCDHGDST